MRHDWTGGRGEREGLSFFPSRTTVTMPDWLPEHYRRIPTPLAGSRIEYDREEDGRWIEEVSEIPGVLAESLLRDLTDREQCPRCGEPINDDMGHMCPPDRL